MRLWKLEKLAETVPVIHICEKCNYRTPLSPILKAILIEIVPDTSLVIEKKIGYCDECNRNIWSKLK